jgi:hemerythrin
VYGRVKGQPMKEKMFEESGYDSFNTKIQIHEHKGFINKVASINLYDLDENQMDTARNVLDFLSRWLDHHILVIDKKFGSFLEENTI